MQRRLGFFALALLLWVLASKAGATVEMLPEAREQYRLGLELYDEREYERALEKFQASFAIYASPNSQLYMARCLRFIGRTSQAIEAYERAVSIAKERAASDLKYSDTLQAAQRELAVLKPPAPAEQRLVPAIGASAATSAAGLASFGVFWALARAKYHTLERECNPLPCPASQTGGVEAGRKYQLAGNISLAVGVAGAVSAVTFYVLGRPRQPSYGEVALVGSTLQFRGEF